MPPPCRMLSWRSNVTSSGRFLCIDFFCSENLSVNISETLTKLSNSLRTYTNANKARTVRGRFVHQQVCQESEGGLWCVQWAVMESGIFLSASQPRMLCSPEYLDGQLQSIRLLALFANCWLFFIRKLLMHNCEVCYLIDGWEYGGRGGAALQLAQDVFLTKSHLFAFQTSALARFWPPVVTLPEIKSGKPLWAHLAGWHQKLWNRWTVFPSIFLADLHLEFPIVRNGHIYFSLKW